MDFAEIVTIAVGTVFVNNFVLAYFLGICPFLGVSARLETATRMGGAVMFVMLVSSTCAYWINALLLAIDAPYLKLISFIAVIASTVQLVEMFIKKMSPALFRALGIFLPLITTNCAILGLAIFATNRGYGFVEGIVYALGAGIGFTLAISVLMTNAILVPQGARDLSGQVIVQRIDQPADVATQAELLGEPAELVP